jgi:cell division protein FtsQ
MILMGVTLLKKQEISYVDKQAEIKLRKKRRKTRIIFFWIKFILIAALAVTTIVLLALSPLFNIKNIEVKGSEHYPQEKIAETSGIIIGSNGFKTIGSNVKNIFTFRYGFAEKNIMKSYPYIKSVIARFIIPSKVRISISERKAEAVITYMGNNLLIDNEAYVLENFGKKVNKGLPLIKGLKIKQCNVGQAITMDNPEAFQDALKLMDQIKLSDARNEQKMYNRISSIDVNDRGKISIFHDSRLTVNFGNLGDLEYRIDFCRKIVYERLAKEDRGFLDMTTEHPSFTPEE